MLKKTVVLFFRALVTAAYWSYRIEGVNALLLILPAKLIVPTLRRYGAQIGEDVIIHSPLIIHNAGESYGNLSIGSKSYFGRAVFLDLKEKIEISERVTISMRTTLLTHTDAGESRVSQMIPPSAKPVKIAADAYLGANVTILEGINIGESSVIGAGSIVLHDVPAFTVAAGNPCREIRQLRE